MRSRSSLPPNAQLIRNLMIGAQYVHDHVMHFYHLHALDWVDVVSALSADPKATSDPGPVHRAAGPSPRPAISRDIQKRLKGFVESGQLGIFANGYWGHPAYKLPPEANLMAVAHYLEALAWQRDAARLHAIFGGKNPHPNFVVGGVACPIDLNSDSAINAKKLAEVQSIITADAAVRGPGLCPGYPGHRRFLQGLVPARRGAGQLPVLRRPARHRASMDPASFLFPRGRHPQPRSEPPSTRWTCTTTAQIQEFVSHSWYDYQGGKDKGLHPYAGETKLDYDGRGGVKPPYTQLDVDDGYSWLKAPRWKGHAVEVGPLARVLHALRHSGHAQTKELVDMTLTKLDMPVRALFSTLGRTAARTLETKILVDAMQGWYDSLIANIKAGDTRTFNEALWDPPPGPARRAAPASWRPRAARLGHWIVIKDGRIDNYQAVVPSTWNAGPRDPKGIARRLRGGAPGQPPAGRRQAADGDPAHHPLLRSLHRLRGAPERPRDAANWSRSRSSDCRPCPPARGTGNPPGAPFPWPASPRHR